MCDLPLSHGTAVSPIRSTVLVSRCLRSSKPRSSLMLHRSARATHLTPSHCADTASPHTSTRRRHAVRYIIFERERQHLHNFLKIYILERVKGERETSVCCLPQTPQPGTEPTTQSRGLTQNGTHNLFGEGMMLQPTEPHRPGLTQLFL